MPNKIKLRRSYTAGAVPLTTDLETNEVCINYADNKLFVKTPQNTIQSITLGGSGGGGGSGSLSGSVTIPASGDEYWANTVLLLKGDGTLADSSSFGRTVTASGNAAATGEAKFGSASLAFDGNGDYLQIPNSSDFNVSGDYVIEMWIKPAAVSGLKFILGNRDSSGNGFELYLSGSVMVLQIGSQYLETASGVISAGQWQHVVGVISGSNSRLYVNGTSVASGTLPTSVNAGLNTFIGCRFLPGSSGEYFYSGLIDDLRFTKGATRGYAGSTITVPTATYTTGTYTAAQTYPVTITGSGGGGGSGLTWSSVPASATASGTAGSIAYDGDYLYVATAANTWERAALSTWSPFGPASVSGLQLWLDASDASTLYDATSGGSLVAADGGVARWEDKSGNARHATQATNANRPLLKPAVQGGKAVLRFDGSNDSLTIGDTGTFKFLHSADSTVFIALTRSSNSGSAIMSTADGGTGTVGWTSYFSNGSSTNDRLGLILGRGQSGVPVSLVNSGSAVIPSGWSVLSFVSKPTDATAASRASLRQNGGTAAADNAATGSVSESNSLGAFTIGAYVGYAADYGGDIAEIVIYNTALSNTDRAAVESYLMNKWGIT